MLIGLFHRLLVGFRVRRSYRFRGRLVNYLIIMVVLGRRGRNSLAFSNNFSPTRSVWFHDLLPFLFFGFFTFRIRLELVVSAPFDCEQEHGSTFKLSIKSTILLYLVLNSFMSRTSTSAIISVCLFRAIVRESILSDRLISRDLGTHTVSLESFSSSATSTKLGWLCHARNPLDRRAVQKPWNCQLAERQTRRVDVFYQNLPHERNSQSRFPSTCLPRSRFLCDRRPTSASLLCFLFIYFYSSPDSSHTL